MKLDIEGLVASTFNQLGILDAYALLRRWISKSHVAILTYHRVCPHKDKWSFESLSLKNFETQIKYISRNYEILSLDKLVEGIQSGKSLPKKAVVVTFDDGYKDNYLHAYPIFQKYHIPATIFLATGYINTGKLFWWDKVAYIIHHTSLKKLKLENLGSYSLQSELDKSRANSIITERLKKFPENKKNLLIEKLLDICQVEIPSDLGKKLILSWEEVKEMSNEGVAFGAHSVSHPILINIPLKQAKKEIIQSKKDIEEKLSKKVTSFSYPNGSFNANIIELVRKSGFNYAVSVHNENLISSKDNIYQLSRIFASEDFNKFKIKICGLWGDLLGCISCQ